MSGAVRSWREWSGRQRALVGTGLLASLGLLMAHAFSYRFLTDDAFISFRYARNLSQGSGLVFNPGYEHVEGYSNFLWVLILAGLHRLGIRPEVGSLVLSFAATVALWTLVVGFALRRSLAPGREWLVLVPATFLAATRSFALWSSSGLETRWFELLVVAGALRLVVEVESWGRGEQRAALAPWLFGFATLTRPDGLLIALAALATAALFLAWRRAADPRRFLVATWPFWALMVGQLMFRWIYYHDWLPNTYYAKVGGRLWWSSGFRYVAAFSIEYAAYLWIPLLVAGVMGHFKARSSFIPLLFASIILPHAFYIIAIGGDHFEYRPIDLYFPFLFLLIYDGACFLATSRWRAAAVGGLLVLMLVGLWELPYQSHRQFIDHYLPGYPGLQLDQSAQLDQKEAQRYLSPDRDPIYRLPGLRAIGSAYQRAIRTLTSNFAGIRQEEHRMFLATVVPEGHRFHRLVENGLLPRDVYIAIGCVGAIPYYSDIRTLDVLGLTDAEVAHGPFASKAKRSMAHDKQATPEYIQQRGVDLWSVEGVHSMCHVTSPCMMLAIREAITKDLPSYAAEVGDGYFLVAWLPQGFEQARRRMPALRFHPLSEPAFVDAFLTQSIAAFQDSLRLRPQDSRLKSELAYRLLIKKDFPPALKLYQELTQQSPDDDVLWENLSVCREKLGDLNGAIEAAGRGLAVARAHRDPERMRDLEETLARYTEARDRRHAAGHAS